MYLPRAAVAYQIAPKTVLRGGYGLSFDTTNVLNLGFDQTGFSRLTSTNVTNDFGMNWLAGNPAAGISPLRDPFPLRADGTRFDLPVRDALGLSARAGRGWTYNGFDLRHARQQRWRVGIQRQFGGTMVLEAAYAGMFTDRVPVSQTQSPLPENFWASGTVRNDAIASNMNANVPNPFHISNLASLRTSAPLVYSDLATQSFFTSATIRKNQLLRAFPHMNGLTNRMSPAGKVRSDALEVSFQRRFSKGFNFNVSYTLMRAREADFFYNEFDSLPSWRTSNDGRPHRLLGTTVFELPFGKGRRFAASGPLAAIVGGFQIALAYEFQPGPLLTWNNLFFYQDLGDISSVNRTLDRWFNTDGFERVAARGPAAFHRRMFPSVVDGVRADMTKDLHASLSRNIAIKERLSLLLRLDVMNVQNRSQFAAPSTNPVASDFGRITSQTLALNRFIQIQAKLIF